MSIVESCLNFTCHTTLINANIKFVESVFQKSSSLGHLEYWAKSGFGHFA